MIGDVFQKGDSILTVQAVTKTTITFSRKGSKFLEQVSRQHVRTSSLYQKLKKERVVKKWKEKN